MALITRSGLHQAPLPSTWVCGEPQASQGPEGPGEADPERAFSKGQARLAPPLLPPSSLIPSLAFLQEKWKPSMCWPVPQVTGTSAISG